MPWYIPWIPAFAGMTAAGTSFDFLSYFPQNNFLPPTAQPLTNSVVFLFISVIVEKAKQNVPVASVPHERREERWSSDHSSSRCA
jgi:hypothetical protein